MAHERPQGWLVLNIERGSIGRNTRFMIQLETGLEHEILLGDDTFLDTAVLQTRGWPIAILFLF